MRESTYTYERKKTSVRVSLRDIPQDLKDEIVLFWKTSKINTAPALAERFGFTVHLINNVLDEYLKNLVKG